MTVAREVVVHGEVQGVGFREFCRREAVATGVSGWVRNEHDGSVLAHFEGDHDAVQTMVAWADHGPPQSTVTSTEARDAAVEGATGFQVR